MTSLTHLEAWGVQITLYPHPKEIAPQNTDMALPAFPQTVTTLSSHGQGDRGRVLIDSGPNMYHRAEIYEGGMGEGYASSLKQTAILNRQEWARLMRPATANCL